MTSRLNFKFKEGTKLRFQLNSGRVFTGEFARVLDQVLVIKNTLELNSNTFTSQLQYFSKTEIRSIRKTNLEDESTSEEDEPEQPLPSMYWKYWYDIIYKHEEIQYINNLGEQTTNESEFQKFVKFLKCVDTVGFHMLPVPTSNESEIKIFVFVTKLKVFVIDIGLIGPKCFDNGIKLLLQSPFLLKVVYDAYTLRYLFNKYKIKVFNFFDVATADVMLRIEKNENVTEFRPLQVLLEEYLQVPSEYINLTKPLSTNHILNKQVGDYERNRAGFTALFLILLKNVVEMRTLAGTTKANKYMLNRTRSRSPIAAKFVTTEDVVQELERMKDLNI